MLINFFLALKNARVPVSITELLHLLDILKARLVYADIDEFYYLSRMALVKDERHYDKFDRAFGTYFKGLEDLSSMLTSMIPDEYLRREFEKTLTAEELEKIKSLGGLEKLIDEFKRQVEEAARGEGKDKNGEYINNGIDCEIWGKSAELVCDKCKKGDSIQVTGTIRRQEWADKQTGDKRSKHVFSVSRFEFLPRAANNTSEPDVF